MNANRLWIIVIALASVVVLVLGWVLGIKPQWDAVIAAHQLRDQVVQENFQHGADLVGLREQFTEIDLLRRDLSQLRGAVPEDWDQASVIETVRETADSLGVRIISIEWLDPVYYAPASATSSAPAQVAEDTSGEGDPVAPDATTNPPATAVPAGIVPVDQADATALTNTLVAVPVTITLNTDYPSILSFTSRLRDSTRLFLVTGAFLDPVGVDGLSTISGLVYVLPGPTR